jgi:Tol biopolymer transport system component
MKNTEEKKMKLGKLLIAIVIVSLLVSTVIPMTSAKKGGGGKPPPEEEPPADPAIAYRQMGRNKKTPHGLMVMNADGTNKAMVYQGEALQPSWAPDGSAIAFCPRPDAVGDDYELMRVDISVVDGNLEWSTATSIYYPVYGTVAWSPVGDAIAFTQRAYDPLVDGEPTKLLRTVDPNGGSLTTIYTAPDGHQIQRPTWNADATKMAFVDNDITSYPYTYTVMILDISTGLVDSVYGPVDHYFLDLDWARTSDVLLFCAAPIYDYNLYTIDLTEDPITPEYILGGGVNGASWSPNDEQIVFGARNFEGTGSDDMVYLYDSGDITELANRGRIPDWKR